MSAGMPSDDEIKTRLRIENDVEDSDIGIMNASARAFVEEFTGRPIEAASRTWLIEDRNPECARSYTRIFTPLYPVLDEDSSGPAVTITDADDEDVTDFRVNAATGMIVATGSTVFNNFPYTVTATVGLSLMDDYATRVEPKLRQAVFDLCADWYQRRNPGALAEGAGGGVITQWQTLGVPERICQQLEPFRLAKAH